MKIAEEAIPAPGIPFFKEMVKNPLGGEHLNVLGEAQRF
jgi:hypothetical protein